MRIVIVADCVPPEQAQAVAPGVVTVSVDGFTDATRYLRSHPADVVITPEAIGDRQTGSCIDVASVARGRGVACVIVTTVWDDGSLGAACMPPGGDLSAAVERAKVARGR